MESFSDLDVLSGCFCILILCRIRICNQIPSMFYGYWVTIPKPNGIAQKDTFFCRFQPEKIRFTSNQGPILWECSLVVGMFIVLWSNHAVINLFLWFDRVSDQKRVKKGVKNTFFGHLKKKLVKWSGIETLLPIA